MAEYESVDYGGFLDRISLQGVLKWAAMLVGAFFIWSLMTLGYTTRAGFQASGAGLLISTGLLAGTIFIFKWFQHPQSQAIRYAKWGAGILFAVLSFYLIGDFILNPSVLIMFVLFLIGLTPGEKRGY